LATNAQAQADWPCVFLCLCAQLSEGEVKGMSVAELDKLLLNLSTTEKLSQGDTPKKSSPKPIKQKA
jgi:hypothetical protein